MIKLRQSLLKVVEIMLHCNFSAFLVSIKKTLKSIGIMSFNEIHQNHLLVEDEIQTLNFTPKNPPLWIQHLECRISYIAQMIWCGCDSWSRISTSMRSVKLQATLYQLIKETDCHFLFCKIFYRWIIKWYSTLWFNKARAISM